MYILVTELYTTISKNDRKIENNGSLIEILKKTTQKSPYDQTIYLRCFMVSALRKLSSSSVSGSAR